LKNQVEKVLFLDFISNYERVILGEINVIVFVESFYYF
jgi:hypothetical protein